MKVLLSINPEHVENIFRGVKTFEFRRKVFARKDVKTVIVYCTMPVGKIVGEFDIESILVDQPREIWKKTHGGSGISEDFFFQYFSGREVAYALKIGDVREYDEHVDPNDILDNFSPPQSYMYMREERRKDRARDQLELL
jgi:predicted transcriptional regulator